MLAFESFGPRCDPLLRQWRPDGTLAAEYIVAFEGNWQQTMVDRVLEWTSPRGPTLREGDLVELHGTVEGDEFCGPGSRVLHAESLAPVLPAGPVAASVSLGERPYMCVEGCVQWISFKRDGDLLAQRAMRDTDVWLLDPGSYEITLFDAGCQFDGTCVRLRPSTSCTANVDVPAADAIRIVLGFQSDSYECVADVKPDPG